MTIPSDEFCFRLWQFYECCSYYQSRCMSPLWADIFKYQYLGIQEAFASQKPDEIRKALNCGPEGGGGIQGWVYKETESDPVLAQELLMTNTMLGLRSAQNPYQPFNAGPEDAVSLLHQFTEYLDLPEKVPLLWFWPEVAPCPCRFGVSAYAAGSLMHMFNGMPKRIMEIGPGYGLIGLLLLVNSEETTYSVIDLPIGCVLVAWIAAHVLGEECIQLAGEKETKHSRLFIFPITELNEASGDYNVIVNSDSFPEIPIPIQDELLRWANGNLEAFGKIYSINHESDSQGQRSVFKAMQQSRFFRPLIRKLFPLRTGYMEEVYVRK